MTAYAPALIQPNFVPFTPAAGGFSPSDISNLEAWFDAGLGITLNGSDVSQWDDQSGLDNHLTQGTAADQPVFNSSDANFNNEPSLSFDGVSEFMATASFSVALSQPNTVFVALRYVSGTGVSYWHDGLTSGNRNIFGNNGGYSIWGGTSWITGSAVDTSVHVFGNQYNTTSSNLYLDGGTADASGSIGSHSWDGVTLGSTFNQTTFKAFDAAELIIYDKLLNDTEMNQVGNYLADKYGTSWVNVGASESSGKLRAATDKGVGWSLENGKLRTLIQKF